MNTEKPTIFKILLALHSFMIVPLFFHPVIYHGLMGFMFLFAMGSDSPDSNQNLTVFIAILLLVYPLLSLAIIVLSWFEYKAQYYRKALVLTIIGAVLAIPVLVWYIFLFSVAKAGS